MREKIVKKKKKGGGVGVGETTFHCRYNSCHLLVKNETRTTKLAVLIIDTSSEIATVNFKISVIYRILRRRWIRGLQWIWKQTNKHHAYTQKATKTQSTLASKTAQGTPFDESGKNTYTKVSALFIVTAIPSHHLPLCIIVLPTFFIYCWMISETVSSVLLCDRCI